MMYLLSLLSLVLAGPVPPVLCSKATQPYSWDHAPLLPPSTGARYVLTTAPHFCQCNSSWGDNFMSHWPNHTRPIDTVCAQGCAMTSVSAYLNARRVRIRGQEANPGTLNNWLNKNNGYVCDPDCDDLRLPVVHNLDPRISLVAYERQFTAADILEWLKNGDCVVLHVQNNTHFVLATGWFEPQGKFNGTFIVRDSYYPRLSRDFSEVTDVLLYSWNASAHLEN